MNAIGPNGVIAPAQQVVATEPNAHCIIFDPTNRYVLHTSLGGDVIYQQKFDAKTGKLTPNDPPTVSVKAKGGPRHLVFSPDEQVRLSAQRARCGDLCVSVGCRDRHAEEGNAGRVSACRRASTASLGRPISI